MIELRPYQQEYIHEILEAFRQQHKRVVLCAPTGAGKTVIFSEIVRRAAFKETSTWILTDRIELFKQTWKALDRVNVVPQLITADTKRISPDALINVGMVETVKRRKGIRKPDLIICDEAHIANFTYVIEAYPDAYVIGATATPIGKHFFKYYTSMVQCTDVPALIDMGSLSPCKTIEMRGQDFSDMEIQHGEYTDESNFNHFNKRVLYDGLIEQIHAHIEHRKTIVYCVNIAHAEATMQELIDAGFTAKMVTGSTPDKEREEIFAGFKFGAFQFLVNVGIATKGYDEPSIEAVIMYLKTNSLIKYLQCVGRGGRTSPGKDYFIHLDFGENVTVHGLWSEPRNWKLEPPKKKKKEQPAPMKDCPQCSAMLHASVRVCNFCGYVFEVDDQTLKQGVAVVVDGQQFTGRKLSDLSVQELYELGKRKRYKSSYIWRVVRSKGSDAVKQFAHLSGFQKGWIYRQMQQITDNNFFDKTIS